MYEICRWLLLTFDTVGECATGDLTKVLPMIKINAVCNFFKPTNLETLSNGILREIA